MLVFWLDSGIAENAKCSLATKVHSVMAGLAFRDGTDVEVILLINIIALILIMTRMIRSITS